MKKNELFSRIWLVLAFFAMWYIYFLMERNVYIKEFVNFQKPDSIWVVLGNNINLLATGLVIFLIPYEYLFSWISHVVYEMIDLFKPASFSFKKINSKYIDTFLLLLLYAGIALYSKNYYWLMRWRLGIVCCLLTLLATMVSFLLYDLISNRWVKYVVSFVLISCGNTIVCFGINSKFITGVIIYCVMTVSWHMYDLLNKKKVFETEIVASIALTFLFFVVGLNLTDHLYKWCDYINPYGVIGNDSSTMMVYLRENPILSADFSNAWDYLQHPFIGINVYMGTPILIIHLVLFLTTIIASIILIKEIAQKSIKRASIFTSIFLWYVFIYMYTLICDLGVFPEATMTFMSLRIYIPAMAVLFKVLWEGKKYLKDKGNIWDKLFEDEEDDYDNDLAQNEMDYLVKIQCSVERLTERVNAIEKKINSEKK